MQQGSNLYFIAIIPPEPIFSEIKEFQKYFADKYNSKEALKRPSHITLIAPFEQLPSQELALMTFTENFASKRKNFELSVEGFGSFTVEVIYAALEKNDALKKLQKELSLSFYKNFRIPGGKGGLPFNAHITIAFKDLSPLKFPDAWKEFSTKLYRRKWMMGSICLLRHNFKEWEIIKRAELKGDDVGETMELGF